MDKEVESPEERTRKAADLLGLDAGLLAALVEQAGASQNNRTDNTPSEEAPQEAHRASA